MSNENKTKNYGCTGGLGVTIFIVFLILKLAEVGVVASWSWWWVTAPLWIPLGIGIIFLIIIGLIIALKS